MEIGYCIHRTSLLLLGLPHYHGGWKASWMLSIGRLWHANQLDIGAFDEAKDVFLDLEEQRLGAWTPVVSRLSQALARTGQYAAEDQILDVAIALEQMYRLDRGRIADQLKTKTACFLEVGTDARLAVRERVGKLYSVRSEIVHGGSCSARTRQEAFGKGFQVARDTVFKLLREGAPPDWK